MFKDRYDYIRATFAHENDAQHKARQNLTDPSDQISIHPEDGKLLQCLIGLANIKTIVEIGTLGGYSALCMVEALPKDGMIYTIEHDIRRYDLAIAHTAHEKRITVIHGTALDVLPDLSRHGPFDMAFLDADKTQYMDYLKWAESNIRCGGVIIADNTFLFDAVWHDDPVGRVRASTRQTMRDVNARLADPKLYDSILLNTVQGMTIARKKF